MLMESEGWARKIEGVISGGAYRGSSLCDASNLRAECTYTVYTDAGAIVSDAYLGRGRRKQILNLIFNNTIAKEEMSGDPCLNIA